MSNHRIADYSLLVLDTLARNCQSIDELHHAISMYPEDQHREGALVRDMTDFVSNHSAFSDLQASIELELSRRGGREALEGMSDSMALSEFIDGWDEVLLARAPFASSSYEPRFAIEDYLSPRTIAAGLRLLPRMLYQVDMDGELAFQHLRIQPGCLVVANPLWRITTGHWTSLPTPLNAEQMAVWIEEWLERKAQYPERPWFEGGEAKGYSMFCVQYMCDEAPHAVYGHLVVLPKWFEIHK